ncbi:MAG: nitrate reductase [Planctomycetales bacterium]|nr:nitrate reductase [Planctomycetales bacterium]
MSVATNNCQSAKSSLGRKVLPHLQKHDGAMTRELLLAPGRYGLGMTHASLDADTVTTATCGYCATGCGLRVHLRDGQAIGLTPATDYPVNLGMACPKGWEALRVLDSTDRATMPLLRKNGCLQPVSWDEALRTFCDRFKAIQQEHGTHSIAFLSTGQIASEEMAFLGALAKFGMGMLHGDGNTRQCMATAVTAYKESFGFDAPPYTYADFEQSDCLVFIGANPCVGHPIMWERVFRNRNQPELIVLDPRATETAMAATQHLQLRPKSDLKLLYAITHEIIRLGMVDESFVSAHTEGFDELRGFVANYSATAVADQCGLTAEQVSQAARSIGTAKAASLWWTMGVNQSYEGVRTAQAIINIALITGNIGRPGTGANSITGQCNAMGSRLWSNTTNLFGHYSFENAEHRRIVADALRIDESRIPDTGSYSYDGILDAVDRGEIRGLWIIATNPSHSWIDQDDVRRRLGRLDFLVVQDMYHNTETVQQSHLLLPAAGWGEKLGTFINSERRYGIHKQVRQSPGQALSDFRIFRAVAEYWGCGEMFREWSEPEAVFRIMQRASRNQPCDITGIEGYQQLDRLGGIQWPWTSEQASASEPSQERRLFADGQFYTESGRAKLITAHPAEMPEAPDDEYPFLLLSGRGTVSQWHTQTRTGKSPILRQLYPHEPYVEIHHQDAAKLGVEHNALVQVRSRRGEISVRAAVTSTVGRNQVFIPMHYGVTNRLTLQHFDPYSRQPSYKDAAVSLSPINAQ